MVRFYSRGGNRRGPLNADTTGLNEATPFGQTNATNLDADIGDASAASSNNSLGLTEAEMDKLVAFLLALTDTRVACHSGVFDHPALPLVMGHNDMALVGSQKAQDIVKTLPAVGRRGFATCLPNSGDLFQMQPALQSILSGASRAR